MVKRTARQIARVLGPAFAALALTSVGALAVDAPSGGPAGYAYDLANDLMSPYCPGRSLADCPSPQADDLRMWILVQESAGRDRADVESELYERFGDVILSAPRAEGIGLTAYAFPIVAALAGVGIVGVFLRRHTRSGGVDRGGVDRGEVDPGAAASPPPVAAASDPELERILDAELARGREA